MWFVCKNSDKTLYNLHKFWDLDSLGIKVNEKSVYADFESDIFEN